MKKSDTYRLYNFVKTHLGASLTIIGAIVAIVAFIIEFVNYKEIMSLIEYWDITISRPFVNSVKPVYSIASAICLSLISLVAGLITSKISQYYLYYEANSYLTRIETNQNKKDFIPLVFLFGSNFVLLGFSFAIVSLFIVGRRTGMIFPFILIAGLVFITEIFTIVIGSRKNSFNGQIKKYYMDTVNIDKNEEIKKKCADLRQRNQIGVSNFFKVSDGQAGEILIRFLFILVSSFLTFNSFSDTIAVQKKQFAVTTIEDNQYAIVLEGNDALTERYRGKTISQLATLFGISPQEINNKGITEQITIFLCPRTNTN